MPRSPASMEYTPDKASYQKEAPIQSAFRYLTATDGAMLQIMTRTNPLLAQAAQVGYIFDKVLGYEQVTPEGVVIAPGNPYVAGYCNQLMCLAISKDAGGREDIIRALGEGGKVPDSFYETKAVQTFEEIP